MVGAAADMFPLRRRLLERDSQGMPDLELETDQRNGDDFNLEETTSELSHRELFAICGVRPKDVVPYLSRLGTKGKALAQRISEKMINMNADTAQLVTNALDTAIVVLEAFNIAHPCSIDEDAIDHASNFRVFLEAYHDDDKTGLAVAKVALSIVGSGWDDVEGELAEVVAPLDKCESARRLRENQDDEAVLMAETRVNRATHRELSICSAIGSGRKKLSTSLARTSQTLSSRVGSRLISRSMYGKLMGAAGGVLDIVSGIKGYYENLALAEEMRVQAVQNVNTNNEAVEAALSALRISLSTITNAMLSGAAYIDITKFGLPFSQVVNMSFEVDEMFKFEPAIWDSVFNDIMDLVEYEALLCPQIEGEGLVSGRDGATRVLRERSHRRNVSAVSVRRSLNPKNDREEAQKRLKTANADFRRVSNRIAKVECPRFERTLRQVVDWGKSMHKCLFSVIDNYRKFDALLTQVSYVVLAVTSRLLLGADLSVEVEATT